MKKFWLIIIVILCGIGISIFSTSFGKEENQVEYPYDIGYVTAESLKIRSGLSTDSPHIGLLSKNDCVTIYGKVDNWYIVKTENNLVGAVFADYIQGDYSPQETVATSASADFSDNSNSTLLSQDEQIFLNSINNKRIENNLPEFEIDERLLNIARLKCQDIVKNKNFSHTSKKYGTLFDMLDSNSFMYSQASENIVRNTTCDGALKLLLSSQSHQENILNQNYNYTGIAVVNSIDWGKVFLQIFVAK